MGEIDLYSDGIFKLVQAVSADKRDHAGRFSRKELADERVDLWFHYPIFVTSGPLYEYPIASGVPRYTRVHRVGFLHRAPETDGLAADCRIDVVDPARLRELLMRIDRESDRIVDAIRKRYKVMGASRRSFAPSLAKMSAKRRIRVISGESLGY